MVLWCQEAIINSTVVRRCRSGIVDISVDSDEAIPGSIPADLLSEKIKILTAPSSDSSERRELERVANPLHPIRSGEHLVGRHETMLA